MTNLENYWYQLQLTQPLAGERDSLLRKHSIDRWLSRCEMHMPAWLFALQESSKWDNRKGKTNA